MKIQIKLEEWIPVIEKHNDKIDKELAEVIADMCGYMGVQELRIERLEGELYGKVKIQQ